VVIVNQAFVKKYFRDGEALGKRISRDDTNPKWATIVGVVADIKHRVWIRKRSPSTICRTRRDPTGKWYWRSAVRKTRAPWPTLFSKNAQR